MDSKASSSEDSGVSVRADTRHDTGPQGIRHPHVIRLAVASAVLGASIIAVRVLPFQPITWQNQIGHTVLQTCSALMLGGIVYCLWVQYRVSAERWILLSTAAFSGLLLGEFVHMLSSPLALGGEGVLQNFGSKFEAAWKIASACLLIAAARVTTIDNRGRRSAGLRVILEALVLSLFLSAATVQIAELWPRIAHVFPGLLRSVLDNLGHWVTSIRLINALSLMVVLAAFMSIASRHIRREDVFSGGITRYLMLATGGQMARLVSTGSYDLAWWAEHLLVAAASLVLLVELGAEFGVSYSNARARIEHLEALHDLSSSLSNTLDLRVVLLALTSNTANMLSARFASVMLADEAGETLVTAATHGLPDPATETRQPQKVEGQGRPDFYSGHTARAFREKRICVVDDIYTDVEFVPWRQLAWCDGYTVSVPLVYQDIPLGVLNLFFDKHVPLNDERIRLFETLASAAAVAIVNAQLYRKTIGSELDHADVPAYLSFRRAA